MLLVLHQQLWNTERSVTDDDLIDKILSTLPPHHDSVVDLITHKTQGVELTIDYVLDTLKNWSVGYTNRLSQVGATSNSSSIMTTMNALVADGNSKPNFKKQNHHHHQRGRGGHRRFNNGNRSQTYTIQCYYCTERDHGISICPIRKRALIYRKECNRTKKNTFNQRNNEDATEYQRNDGEASIATVVRALMATINNRSTHKTSDWILDSGDSHHFAKDTKCFIPDMLHRLSKHFDVRLSNGVTGMPSI
jgi:hypothetical protein